MKITSGRNPLAVGVDYREEYPKVCYQSIQMKEAQPLPLDSQDRQVGVPAFGRCCPR